MRQVRRETGLNVEIIEPVSGFVDHYVSMLPADRTDAVPRLMLPLSLSWDHRVIDGASAARFNAYLGQILSDFRRVLL